ncbi:MAG: hypothetical protein QOH50_1896 [Kribbellaceae bacterium]|jgi:hypothetical protein|nr:hypothetical protein [Kribbellaceae bacterium]
MVRAPAPYQPLATNRMIGPKLSAAEASRTCSPRTDDSMPARSTG